MNTLLEIVTGDLMREQRKHDKGDHYTTREINKLTNMELLKLISDTLDRAGFVFGSEDM